MPAINNKQRVLSHLLNGLKKRYAAGTPEPMPVLEQFLYAVVREGTTREQADKAFKTLRERFFDWNEIRVSSHREVEEVLRDLPDAELKAQRLISLLQEVFETTFSFDLESMQKKGLKQAAKQLSRFQAANDYSVAWVVQNGLGGHAVPVDEPSERCLRRLGLVDGNEGDPEAIRASFEHQVPKASAPVFGEVVSAVADEFCLPADPQCESCPLGQDCPTAQGQAEEPTAARGGRPKPR